MKRNSHVPPRSILPLFICSLLLTGSEICPEEESAGKVILKVNLFPCLPHSDGSTGFKGLTARIKEEFEKANPDVELQLTLDDNDCNSFYNLDHYKQWLQRDYDVVEPDTLFLTALVDADLIDPWPDPDFADWARFDKSAAQVRGKTYAMPHWLCGYFIFTRNRNVADAKDGGSLISALKAANSTVPKITGNLSLAGTALASTWTVGNRHTLRKIL
jgi:thiamine pyridinylase